MTVRTGVDMSGFLPVSSVTSPGIRLGSYQGALPNLSVYPRARLGYWKFSTQPGFKAPARHSMQIIPAYQSTAISISVFMRDANTDQGVAGLAAQLVITSKKNGAGFLTVVPTITDRGNGWYDVALTSSMVDTLGYMPLRIFVTPMVGQAPVQENDENTVLVQAINVLDGVRAGLTAIPNATAGASGGLPELDSNLLMDVDVKRWLAVAPNALASGNVPADVVAWLGSAPAVLTANGYIQSVLLRWLTDNTGGTPLALISGLVQAEADVVVAADVNVVQWLGSTPAALDGSGNVPANIEAISTAGKTAIAVAVLDAARSGHLTLGTIGEGIALATSLLQGNFFIDEVTPGTNGPTAQRLRCFLTGSATSSATAGGSGEGEFATFLVTTAYSGPNAISTHRVVQQ